MSKRAVLLAGGKGTRLRPYTVVLPKPLMPLGDFPILEVIIRQLVQCGFDHLTMAVNHQAELIQAFFGNGDKWGVTIDYSLEDQPLSTMGPLKLIPDLPENFLAMNGDVLTDLKFDEFFDHHVEKGNLFTTSSTTREDVSEYGVLEYDAENRLTDFREKPVTRYDVSMGIYMINRKVLDFIPKGQFYGYDHLMKDMIATDKPPHVLRHSGYWLDIGREDDYRQAIEEFETLRPKLLK